MILSSAVPGFLPFNESDVKKKYAPLAQQRKFDRFFGRISQQESLFQTIEKPVLCFGSFFSPTFIFAHNYEYRLNQLIFDSSKIQKVTTA